MNKNIIIRIGIILVVLGIIHTVLWFFKAGQLEKQVTNLIAENSPQISSGEIKVAGYPLSQKLTIKDLKFTIPNPAFNKYQTTIQSLEAKAGIFDNNFAIRFLDKVLVQDTNGASGNVEFNQEPKISLVIDSGMIAKFTYQDTGYKVIDSLENTIYSVASSNIAFESSVDQGDKIKNKIKADFKEVENFDLLNIYKNSSEKNVIDGIKSGQISVSGGVAVLVATNQQDLTAGQSPAANNQNPPAVAANSAALNNVTAANPVAAPTANTANNNVVANNAASNAANPAPAVAPNPAAATAASNAAQNNPAPAANPTFMPNGSSVVVTNDGTVTNINNPTQQPAAKLPLVDNATTANVVATMPGFVAPLDPNAAANGILINNGLVKSDFSVELEYILTPNSNSSSPTDPIQIQQTPVQYSKTINIISAELSNSLYKINVNGTLNSFADDNTLSGALTVEIQKSMAFIDYLSAGLAKMADQKVALAAPDAQPTDLANNNNSAQDAYNNLIKKIGLNLKPVAIELAAKNKLTKDDDFVFDVRREKNLEFLINETPIREILGKFN
jgi:hypothetical protein